MLELIKGNASDSHQPYLKLICNEPFFQKTESFNTVLLNFITLAVHDGEFKTIILIEPNFIATSPKYYNFCISCCSHLGYFSGKFGIIMKIIKIFFFHVRVLKYRSLHSR